MCRTDAHLTIPTCAFAQQSARRQAESLLGEVLAEVEPLDASLVEARVGEVAEELARFERGR
ncbi:hypothetical protein E1295_31620 [Nonomuraea mesophila]|uniref:Uncharacterized protein n=1 Tax=Nonomuraea mesophila TaxID=2530382 RepID=A0A4R5EZN4_9ACTN|nr:hypothetical protein E1295_31620 [Nonomuraea mesophila]